MDKQHPQITNAHENDEDKKDVDHLLNKVFFKKYKLLQKLGAGSFGKLYKAEYKNKLYALKLENKDDDSGTYLEYEATILTYLKGLQIPLVKSYGEYENYNVLIMELLGNSLEHYKEERKIFSMKTTCMLGIQMLDVIHSIHDKHIIHRDMKPDNLAMGLNGKNDKLYVLDFGLAKKFRSSRTLKHNPRIKRDTLIGNARFASIQSLEYWEQSRRDDLEAISYILMYFLMERLPWQNLKIPKGEDRDQIILKKKKSVSAKELCHGYPHELEIFVDYCRKLGYEEEPDYEKLKSLLQKILDDNNEKFDYIYDWTKQDDLEERQNLNSRHNAKFETQFDDEKNKNDDEPIVKKKPNENQPPNEENPKPQQNEEDDEEKEDEDEEEEDEEENQEENKKGTKNNGNDNKNTVHTVNNRQTAITNATNLKTEANERPEDKVESQCCSM